MSRVPIKFLEHTADIKIEVFGKNLEEFLKNCAKAMAMILLGKNNPLDFKIKDFDIERKIKVKFNKETLPIDFLNEILYHSDVENAVFFEVKNIEIKKDILKAKILGKKVSGFKEDIKAVTYHSNFEKTKQGYKGVILFDI